MISRSKICVLVFMVLLLGCGLVIGCAQAPVAEPAEKPLEKPEVLKIGGAWCLSGAMSAIVVPLDKMHKLVYDQINEAGGLMLGGKKYVIEYMNEDTKYTAADTLSAVEKLINQGCKFINGPIPSAGTVAIVPVCEQYKVPFFYISSVLTPLESVAKGEVSMPFTAVSGTRVYRNVIYKYILKDNPDIKTIVIMANNDASGYATTTDSLIGYTYFGIPRENIKIVLFPRDTTDFMPYVTKALEYKPDLIDTGNDAASQVSLIIKNLHEKGYKGPVFNGIPMATEEFAQLCGGWDNLNGFISATAPIDDPLTPPAVIKRIKDYEAKYNEPGNASYIQSPDVIPGLLKLADSIDPEKVVKAAETGESFESCMGPISIFQIGPWAHRTGIPIFISEVIDGRVKVRHLVPAEEIVDVATKTFAAWEAKGNKITEDYTP